MSLSHHDIDAMIRDIMPHLSSEEQQLFTAELDLLSQDYITETNSVIKEIQTLTAA